MPEQANSTPIGSGAEKEQDAQELFTVENLSDEEIEAVARPQQSLKRQVPDASAECSVRNISDANPTALEFEEGPPRRTDPSIEAFNQNVADAQRLEKEISDAETQTEQHCEQLRAQQLLLAFRAYTHVTSGKVPLDIIENFIVSAGVKRHGNEKIPCSRLMRAIVGESEARGTPRFRHKKKRATTYASAVDFAVQQGMSQEAFEVELRHPATPGERHGIEHLAKLGRKLRRGEPTESSDPPADMPFRVEGDLFPMPPGIHLMVFRVVRGEPTLGAPLTVPESLFRRVLAAHNKSPRSNHTG